mgnify:FL=1
MAELGLTPVTLPRYAAIEVEAIEFPGLLLELALILKSLACLNWVWPYAN